MQLTWHYKPGTKEVIVTPMPTTTNAWVNATAGSIKAARKVDYNLDKMRDEWDVQILLLGG
jgi:hypothetical protein